MVVAFNVYNKVDVNSRQNILLTPKNNPNFRGLQKDTVYIEENAADKILRENRVSQQRNINEKNPSKYLNITMLPALATVFGSYVYVLNKIIKAKIQKLPQNEISQISKNALIKGGITSLLGITTWLAGTSYFSSQRGKYVTETRNYFNNINNTSARLAEKDFNSSFVSAFYNGASGEIYINKNNLNDSWSNYKNKFTIKHELVHAKQYETVARMDDGVKKLNYAIFKNNANYLKKDTTKKQMICEAYNDIISDKKHKYENAKFSYDGYEIPFKDYVITMYKLINNKEKNYTDIPMLINAKHYNSVKEKLGDLTQEEKLKAKEYYNAILNYTPADSMLAAFSPFSKYRNGILEKEAYKENPWYTMII